MDKNTKTLVAIALVFGLAVYFGYIQIPNFNFQGAINNGGNNNNGGGTDLTNTLDFILTDVYAGSAQASKTIYIYDGDRLMETLTTASDGSIESTFSYAAGERLNVLIDEGTNEHWVTVVVPQHQQTKIDASDPTPVYVQGSDVSALTDYCYIGGTVTADDGLWNDTASSNVATWIMGWSVNTDDTGLLESAADPIYGVTPGVYAYLKLSGGSYDQCSVTGADGYFVLGAAHYYWWHIPATEVSKDKVGVNYVQDGAGQISFYMSTGGVASNVTAQFEIYEYWSPDYFQSHGINLPDSTELAETTVTIYA